MVGESMTLLGFVIFGISFCDSLNHGPLRQSAPNSVFRVRSGFEDFKEILLWNDAFVDKSLFIKDVLEEFAKVIVIARPRKWGKTVNMDMLKRFLEIEADPNGINYRLFEGGTVDLGVDGKHAFKPLKVTNHSKIMEQMGKYPIITVSFKPIKGYGFNRILNTLKVTLMKLFKTHDYLHHSLSVEEKIRFDRYTVANLTEFDMRHGIKFLSELLYKHYNKNVILLIDDYDTPIISSYWELMENEQELHSVLKLFRDLFATSVNSPFIHKSVITGLVLFDNSANIFAEINTTVAEYSLHSKKYTSHFGFTTTELDNLLAKVSTSVPPSEIKRYYNGFSWGEQNLFNPYSILQCLVHDGQLDQYWIDSASSLTIDVRVFKGTLAQDFPLLEEKGIFIYKIYEEINFMEIFEGFREMWFSLLVMGGYLDVAEDVDYAGDYGYRVWLPNQEIKDKFVPKVLKWVFYNDGDCIVSIDL